MNERGAQARVVIAGGGVAALEATLALLIAPERDFVYRPLAVADPFLVGETRSFPLAKLAEAAGGSLSGGKVAAVDAERRVVTTENGREIAYDALLVALGARLREAVPNALTFLGPESGTALTSSSPCRPASAGRFRFTSLHCWRARFSSTAARAESRSCL
jgi:sulfide:quinone oxidoreductase